MAKKTEGKISLKLVVDTEENKVIFAEADKHFVDILFSFLTLPVGTIARLLGNESQLASIWSLTSLYEGADGLDPEYFSSQDCKKMLLRPTNAAGHLCKKLKLNIDDTELMKYFCCSCLSTPHLTLSKRPICSSHKASAYQEINLVDGSPNTGGHEYDGVFTKSGTKFIITDDLLVTPATYNSTYNSMRLALKNHGISESRKLKGMTLKIGSQMIMQLLELALFSKSPLTDTFLRKEKLYVPAHFLAPKHVGNVFETLLNRQKITIKLVYRKSDYKVVYAEAKEDFIDFLFSILALPLGTIVEFFGADSSVTCIDNLYKSVNNLDAERLLESDFHKAILLSPKLPPTYQCKNQLLDVHEVNTPNYYVRKCSKGGWHLAQRKNSNEVKAFWLDPRAPAEGATGPCGYMKESTNFMVTDDLIVAPLSPFSSLDLLNKLGVSFSNVAQREISIGRKEALCLLKASLISTSALTKAFNSSFIIRDPKQDPLKTKIHPFLRCLPIYEFYLMFSGARKFM